MTIFPELKKYSKFILDNYLETFTEENISSAKKYSLPANNIIFSWPKEKHYSFIKKRTETFLNFFSTEDPVYSSIIELKKWQNNQLPHLPEGTLSIEDLTISYSIRKEIFIKILPCYTQDISLNNKILLEFEEFYRKWQKAAFKILFEIQNRDLIQKVNQRTLEVTQKNEELKRINTDLDNFIYTASHDLRAPVSNIEGLMLALKGTIIQENIEEDQLELIDLIEQSIQRFKDTIQDLADIGKVQKNFSGEESETVNLTEIIDDVKVLIGDLIKTSDVSFILDFKDCENVLFSKVNLRSIFYNLISNAIKYRSTTRKPVITISAKDEGECICIKLKDNGLGIKKQNLAKAFQMFRRFHDHVEGTGIGLYIVKRIIDNSSGKIELESEEDKGTTFKIYLKK